MEIDGEVWVNFGSSCDVDVRQYAGNAWKIESCLRQLPIKRPYLINYANVEYVEGDWNEDKTEYGIRIGYASGMTRCFWGETARKVLETIACVVSGKDDICDKFDARVKAGPPKM